MEFNFKNSYFLAIQEINYYPFSINLSISLFSFTLFWFNFLISKLILFISSIISINPDLYMPNYFFFFYSRNFKCYLSIALLLSYWISWSIFSWSYFFSVWYLMIIASNRWRLSFKLFNSFYILVKLNLYSFILSGEHLNCN